MIACRGRHSAINARAVREVAVEGRGAGFVMGAAESLVAETIEARVGAIQVHRTGTFEKRDRQPLALHLTRDPALEAQLRATPHVKAMTPRISFSGLLTNGSRGAIAVLSKILSCPGTLPWLNSARTPTLTVNVGVIRQLSWAKREARSIVPFRS